MHEIMIHPEGSIQKKFLFSSNNQQNKQPNKQHNKNEN